MIDELKVYKELTTLSFGRYITLGSVSLGMFVRVAFEFLSDTEWLCLVHLGHFPFKNQLFLKSKLLDKNNRAIYTFIS